MNKIFSLVFGIVAMLTLGISCQKDGLTDSLDVFELAQVDSVKHVVTEPYDTLLKVSLDSTAKILAQFVNQKDVRKELNVICAKNRSRNS